MDAQVILDIAKQIPAEGLNSITLSVFYYKDGGIRCVFTDLHHFDSDGVKHNQDIDTSLGLNVFTQHYYPE